MGQVASDYLRPPMHHLNPGSEAEGRDRLLEEAGSAGVAVDERAPDRGPVQRENKTRHTAPTAEIEQPSVRSAAGRLGESSGVVDVWDHLARPEEAQPTGFLQHGAELAHAQTGLITTRRRGSSPSDDVETPSIVLAVSCTTLRSAGCMGSSTFRAPDANTSSAT